MDSTNKVKETESLAPGIYKLPGEPAILINGFPPKYPRDGSLVACGVSEDVRLRSDTGLGEWFIGRNVRKLFGEKSYRGKVTSFDKEKGWYRVVYEDGCVEDLELHELEAIIEPLDIKIPLEKVAKNIIKSLKNSTMAGQSEKP